jgi:hypothetical protein
MTMGFLMVRVGTVAVKEGVEEEEELVLVVVVVARPGAAGELLPHSSRGQEEPSSGQDSVPSTCSCQTARASELTGHPVTFGSFKAAARRLA